MKPDGFPGEALPVVLQPDPVHACGDRPPPFVRAVPADTVPAEIPESESERPHPPPADVEHLEWSATEWTASEE